MAKPGLRLLAEDEEDLKIISAHVQDAVVRVGDLAYLPKARRFALLLNRYRWEDDADVSPPPDDGAPMGLAALAETWMGPNGEELDTVAIVTAAASADLAGLHHRVPVTIGADDFARWLDCSDDDAESVMVLMAPPHEGQFAWHEVSTRVNRVANDDPACLDPPTETTLELPRMR